jgi:hypothetical protein
LRAFFFFHFPFFFFLKIAIFSPTKHYLRRSEGQAIPKESMKSFSSTTSKNSYAGEDSFNHHINHRAMAGGGVNNRKSSGSNKNEQQVHHHHNYSQEHSQASFMSPQQVNGGCNVPPHNLQKREKKRRMGLGNNMMLNQFCCEEEAQEEDDVRTCVSEDGDLNGTIAVPFEELFKEEAPCMTKTGAAHLRKLPSHNRLGYDVEIPFLSPSLFHHDESSLLAAGEDDCFVERLLQ